MEKSRKVYTKALKKYHEGNIDKAMDLCDKCIEINRTNTSAINLKGLLYYFKGDLDNSQKYWRLSYKINNDEISKKYLKDIKNDNSKLELYIKAQDCIQKVKISEAIDLLKSCAETHYNIINVNNYLALCYIKRGEYEKAIKYINEVLRIDKKNEMANKNYNMLIEFGAIEEKNKHKIVIKSIMFIAAICIVILLGSIVVKKVKNINFNSIIHYAKKTEEKVAINNKKEEVNPKLSLKNENKTTESDKSLNISKNKTNETKAIKEEFPYEKIKKSIESKNIEQIYVYVEQYSSIEKGVNEKILMSKAEEMLKTEGVNYFYNKGYAYIQKLNYKEANKWLLKIYPYAKGNDVYEEIVYLLATSFEKIGDFENALKYYIQYEKEFAKGSYIEEVLYKLATINNEIDINMAKQYAKKLKANYPNSEYNNSIIENIINK